MKKIVTTLFFNSWVKTILFLFCCGLGTYFTIIHFSDLFVSFFNWRSKEFWTGLAILVPSALLFPTLVNGLLFLKIIQIADNTKKSNKLLQEQINLLEKILKEKK